ncbi:Uncharacterised protein [Helicobacter fennelliae]|uniref:Uncharacterized protein n=1 Tax=Helicobacter fennelliae TaxID=215 RepID=A0A2X3EMP1_9HELI|nr:toprim domain-containing protein [Helicobacter fennelliae]SQC36287.1 Uncharacterised protein [Helicobacter fennelliae]
MRPYDFVLLPIQEILLNVGYYIKSEKSSKHHITMSNELGDIIIITRKPNGHYLYFNPFNENDKGNIHHFCKIREIKIKELLKGKKIQLTHKILPTELNNKEIKAAADFKGFKSINLKSQNQAIRGTYLRKRGIDEEFFKNFNIKIDTRNNICFPLYCYENKTNPKDLTLCGYTAKLNQALTKDKQGKEYKKPITSLSFGKKGLEILKHLQTKNLNEIQNLIITETSIDSLSFLQLKNLKPKETLLCGTNGTISQNAENALMFLFENCNKDIKVFLGFDNDKQGIIFTEKLKNVTKLHKLQTFTETPKLKDFNEDLQNFQKLSFLKDSNR